MGDKHIRRHTGVAAVVIALGILFTPALNIHSGQVKATPDTLRAAQLVYTPETAVQPAETAAAVNATKRSVASSASGAITARAAVAKPLDVDPNNAAAGNPLLSIIAASSQAVWFGGWSGDIMSAVRSRVDAAAGRGAAPVLVAYNIPQRDCGSYSAGGSGSAAAYQGWIDGFAAGIGGRAAIVVLEPDALAQADCLSANDRQTRYNLLSYATNKLGAAGVTVYIDAGHGGWKAPADMANRLKAAGVGNARGFSLNVSNFNRTADETNYGNQISQAIGRNTHFVIDTSRNGNGPAGNNEWCNPSGRALGSRPTILNNGSLVDAYLWIKVPGESDGTCNGGPSAGTFWPDYALGLIHNAQ